MHQNYYTPQSNVTSNSTVHAPELLHSSVKRYK